MTSDQPIRAAVIVGSRRPHRRARAVAEWVCAGPAVPGLELTVVDLDEVALPQLAEPRPAMSGEYALPHTRAWSQLVSGYDAFVLVTPEYNHSTSAALKDALDHLYEEWHDKAVAFVGYGTDGGVRAVEHLRGITAELGLAGVGPSVALSIFDDFDETGTPRVRERQEQARARMLAALRRWAGALSDLRTPTRESGAADAVPGGRPRLARDRDPGSAQRVAERLVTQLQDGLDRGDADLYDSSFADDVLWGTPYGQVLIGYEPLNTAHRSMMGAPALGGSRYELVQCTMPAEGVVTAHVRRRSLGPAEGTGPEFSEMALYVLVEREGRWW